MPRKDHYRVPKWAVQEYKRKGKQIVSGPFICPNCKSENLRININKSTNQVIAKCNCKLRKTIKFISAYEPIDYYNKLIDEP